MAVDTDELDAIAATVAAIYREAETTLVRLIARHLAGDLDSDMQSPEWADRKLAAVRTLRRSAQAVIAGLQATSDTAVRDAAVEAFRAGWRSALAELPAQWFPRSGLSEAAQAAADEVPGFGAIEALAEAVHADIGERQRNILRDVIDTYRAVIAATVSRTLTGTQSRREAAQAAWTSLRRRGITGFTDRAGRRWALSTYVEMATRTVTQRAAVAGQTDRLEAMGQRLVYVSNSPQECALCRPFEGRILRLGVGPTGPTRVRHTITGEMVTVDITATLDAARLAGLFHPQCRHSISAYLPGVTKPPPQPTADPAGDEARQRQRALERKIRRAKTDEAAALDDQASARARAKVRAAQAQLREHLEANPTLKRLRYREQIGAGNIPPAGRDDAAGDIGPVPPQLDLDGNDTPAGRPEPRPQEAAPPAEAAVEVPGQMSLDDAPPAAAAPAPPRPRDLADLDDDALTDLMNTAAADGDEKLLDAVLAEMDRRGGEADQEPDPNAAQWTRFEELTAQGVAEADAYADAFGLDVDQVRRDDAIARLRADGYRGNSFEELARAAFRVRLEHDLQAAEAATNGYLLSRAGRARGVSDPRELWRANEATARAWASEELLAWWDDHGRLTFAQFKEQILTGRGGQAFRTGGETWLQ